MFFKTTQNIIISLRDGDEEAFVLIHQSMVDKISRYVKTFVDCQFEKEDIVAETFAALFLNRSKIKSATHLQNWLYLTAKNRIIDYHRNMKKNKDWVMDCQSFLYSNEMPRKQEKEMEDELFKVLVFIKRMPPQRQAVVSLFFMGQKSTNEIASIMNLHPQTVRNHKTVALAFLRQSLSRQEYLS